MNDPVAEPAYLTKAYGSHLSLSTHPVPPARWRMLQLLLIAIAASTALCIGASLTGLGDPTIGWRKDKMAALVPAGERDGYRSWLIAPQPAPPFIIEFSFAAPASPYGFWLADRNQQKFLVDPQGYISYGSRLDWRPFIHVRRDINQLTLQVEVDGRAIWRVNDEIAWADAVENRADIGLMMPADVTTRDFSVHIYTHPT